MNPAQGFTVIAHRGACGYLPEHTLAGTAMAHAWGVDYIEQDVVLTRDNELIVLHDLYLDAVSDVAIRYPGRQREDGHFYAIDFELAEIRSLLVHERLDEQGKPVFPGRFPAGEALFKIPTLDEVIRLIQGLNDACGREVGIYVEPKSPAWHRREGKDLVCAVVELFDAFGYQARTDRAYLQSFDLESLKYARHKLGSDLTMTQLIGENSWEESPDDFNYLRTDEGLAEIASIADGIGPWLPQVAEWSGPGAGKPTGLVEAAHRRNLFVHAYTLRADRLPSWIDSMDAAVKSLQNGLRLDGLFTDQADQVILATRRLSKDYSNNLI